MATSQVMKPDGTGPWIFRLPSEMVSSICAEFCEHCHLPDAAVSSKERAKRIRNNWDNLRSLCLVSKVLRDAAQPVLFHAFVYPSLTTSHPDMRISMGLFHRSLFERDDLRKCVRALEVLQPHCSEACTYDVYRPLTELNKTEGYLVDLLETEVNLWKTDSECEMGEIMVQALILQLPSLQKVCISAWYVWEFQELKDALADRLYPLVGVPLFPKIKHLEMNVCRQPFVERLVDWQWCSQPAPVHGAEDFMVLNSPNVRILSCTTDALKQPGAWPKLEKLRLVSWRTKDSDLQPLMGRLTSLDHLWYCSEWPFGVTCDEMQDFRNKADQKRMDSVCLIKGEGMIYLAPYRTPQQVMMRFYPLFQRPEEGFHELQNYPQDDCEQFMRRADGKVSDASE